MSEHITPPAAGAGEPPAWQPAAPAGPTTPPPYPPSPAPSASPAPPARVIKLWQAVVVGAACLVVGLSAGGVFGGLIGVVVGQHHHARYDGPFGPGVDGRFGDRLGQGGFGGFGNGARPDQSQQGGLPGGQGHSPSSPAPPEPPAKPSAPPSPAG